MRSNSKTNKRDERRGVCWGREEVNYARENAPSRLRSFLNDPLILYCLRRRVLDQGCNILKYSRCYLCACNIRLRSHSFIALSIILSRQVRTRSTSSFALTSRTPHANPQARIAAWRENVVMRTRPRWTSFVPASTQLTPRPTTIPPHRWVRFGLRP